MQYNANTVAQYTEEFSRIYGGNRVKVKPAYNRGKFEGYSVSIDGDSAVVLNENDMQDAIKAFKA